MYNFDPPRLSLEPHLMMNRGRPTSAIRGGGGGGGGSGSQPRSNSASRRPLYNQTSSMNFVANNRPISAGGYQSGNHQNGSGNNNNNGTSSGQVVATQERLIQNLKQQVDLLQREVNANKSQGSSPSNSLERNRLPPRGSPATHAVIPLPENDYHDQNNNNDAASRFLLMGNQNAQRQQQNAAAAGQFSNDVANLRQRHQELEQHYGQQLAQLRRQLEEAHTLLLEGDMIDPRSLSGPRLIKRNPADARQRIAADERNRQHSLEIIELQKQINQLKSQIDIKNQELASMTKEKEAMVDDLVAAKDAGRTALNEISMQKNQVAELQKELRLEQEQRHVLQDKLNTIQRNSSSLYGGSTGSNTPPPGSVEDYEAKIRQLTAQLSVAKCEAESARMAEAKWRNEIESIAQQNAELARAAEISRENAARSDAISKETQGKLEDTEAQREFLQLTVDRMRIEETSVNARHHQLENILRAERENIKELEKRYNRALEEKESLMRNLRQRDSDQTKRDAEDTKMRAQAKYAIDTSDAIKKENEELRHKVADLTRRLETTMDMQSTEKQINTAIQRMEQAKYDMQNLLQKQIRIAHDVSGAISAMPKKSVHQSPASRKAAANLSASADTISEQQQVSGVGDGLDTTQRTAATSGDDQ